MPSKLPAIVALLVALVLCGIPCSAFAGDVDAPDTSATLDGVSYGVKDFERLAKGTERVMDGQPEGYRFPVDEKTSLIVAPAADRVVVWIDRDAAVRYGIDPGNDDDLARLKELIGGLDAANAMGGTHLDELEGSWYATSDDTFACGGYTYAFNAQGADGDRYVTVASASGDAHGGARWLDSCRIVDAAAIAPHDEAGPIERLAAFLGGIDMRPFWVSLKTSALALGVSFALGLAAAWKTMGTTSRVKGLLDSVFTIPMVLPPTVCGFLLLMLFGRSTGVGRWLIAHGISLVFTWPAAVISAIVVSFPLVYRTALGAFESLDAQMLDAARTLGWSERKIFIRLMMPLGWPSIAAGAVLAFARAMGEFGCTLFFAGNYAGVTQTIPIAIYFEWMGGNTAVALFWVVVVIAFSFAVILFINVYTAHAQAYRGRGLAGSKRQRVRDLEPSDSLEATGGDALRIDRAALAELMRDGGGASAEGGC